MPVEKEANKLWDNDSTRIQNLEQVYSAYKI